MRKRYFILLVVPLLFLSLNGNSGKTKQIRTQQKNIRLLSVPGQFLVKYKKIEGQKIQQSAQASIETSLGINEITHFSFIDVHLYKGQEDIEWILNALNNNPLVEYAEPDYLAYADVSIPNDELFDLEYGLHNTGQSGGTADADIDAPEAWDITTGSAQVLVAVIDTGVDYNHEDLNSNMWINPLEIPDNGLDDDGNGWVDDIYGINAITETGDPMDDHDHGTHCAGTIGAKGNNDTGVAGVCWTTSLMALKFLDDDGIGSYSNSIKCIEYAIDKGAHIISSSWGGTSYSSSLKSAIEASVNAGILFVAAAGNDGNNTDQAPHYPAAFDLDGIISVAATDDNDQLASFSNYGQISVDIAAPGDSVASTWRNNRYGYMSGTSMAAPHVAGLSALLKSLNLSLNWPQIKGIILSHNDPLASLSEKVLTGGRINAHKTLLTQGTDQPTISLSLTSLYFGATVAGEKTQNQVIQISNSGEGILNWAVEGNKDWLTISTLSGTGKTDVSVSVDPSKLSAGTYNALLTVSSANATNSPETVGVVINIYNSTDSSPPFGRIDSPTEGSTGAAGALPISGWVLDDIETTKVEIWRDPTGGEIFTSANGLLYIGDAIFVDGARPDIESAYFNYPLNKRGGWGYLMLTNALPNGGNGIFRISAIAIDRDGHSVTLDTKTFSCDNANSVKPFGTIDTPAQGGETSGSSFINFGWALTPLPNTIPTDGSTIQVWIDGVITGNVDAYDLYRPDITENFPVYTNSNGAVGYFILDTTAYSNGIHTIAWTVTDDVGNTDGIGSRYFNITNPEISAKSTIESFKLNILSKKELSLDSIQDLPPRFDPIQIQRGFIFSEKPVETNPNPYGVFEIKIKEVERIAIKLREGTTSGYMIVGNQFRSLPIGSTLDTNNDIFSWLPGPGFIGTYELVFIYNDHNMHTSKTQVRVRIVPKY